MADSIQQNGSSDKSLSRDDVLNLLKGRFSKATFDTHINPIQIVQTGQTTLVLACAPNSQDWLEQRLKPVILSAVQSIKPDVVDVVFVPKEPSTHLPIDEPDEHEPDDPDAEFQGVYYDLRNAIIQPDKLEIHTQYFRRKWRPLLGPMLSELIRELRQRCHYKSGRNSFKTTYQSLAQALGVSEPTIKRALARNKDGNFKNELLDHFIADMHTIKESPGRRKIRTKGTQFTIYLDDPLTPEDQEKLDQST